MDKLRDLILDLTKNNIAKKKELLSTSDAPENQERIKDLEQIDALDVDPSILHAMQDPSLDKIKEARSTYNDNDFGFSQLGRDDAKKRIARFIKDKSQIIGNPSDYEKDQVPNKDMGFFKDHEFSPLDSYNQPKDWRELQVAEPEPNTWSEEDVKRLKQKVLRKLINKI